MRHGRGPQRGDHLGHAAVNFHEPLGQRLIRRPAAHDAGFDQPRPAGGRLQCAVAGGVESGVDAENAVRGRRLLESIRHATLRDATTRECERHGASRRLNPRSALTNAAGGVAPRRSRNSRPHPLRAAGAIFERDAECGETLANLVGGCKILVLAGGGAKIDQ